MNIVRFRPWLLALLSSLTAISLTAAPVITGPTAQNGTVNGSATFSVTATGSGTLTFQWQRNGVNLATGGNITVTSGASSSTCQLSPLSRSDADFYDVVVTDTSGPSTSSLARLTVAPTATPTLVALDPAWSIVTEGNFGTGNVILPLAGTAAVAPGGYYVGGQFTSVNGAHQTMIMRVKADGTLDTGFAPLDLDNSVLALAVQSDGRLIVGGSFLRVGGALGRSFLVRLNTDGTVDPTFNASLNASVNALVLQPDGGIVIGGNFGTVNGTSRNDIARLNPDGSLDSSFNPGTGFNSSVSALALQSNGSVVVGGSFTSFNGVSSVNRIVRLTNLGAMDPSLIVGTGVDNPVNALAIQAKDGAILLGGNFQNYNGNAAGRLARISSTGTFDSAYNTAIGTGFGSTVNAITLLGDTGSVVGSALIGGSFATLNGVTKNFFTRLTNTGAPDGTFTPAAPNGTVLAVALQSDGHIIIAGNFSQVGSGTGTVRSQYARLNSDGSLDPASILLRSANNSVSNVLPLSGGQVIVAGNFSFLRGNAVPGCLVRLTSTGALDPSFNANGTVTQIVMTNGGSGYTTAPTVTLTGGGGSGATATATVTGGVVVSVSIGAAGTGYTSAPTVVFSGGGGTGGAASANINGTGANSTITGATLLPDGRIAIAGNFTTYNGTARNRIAIIKADGTLDPAFAPSGPVSSITVNNIGSGYTTAPTVSFTGGGGTGAAGTAVLSGTNVISVTVTNGGSGYTSAPTVVFTGGGGTGAAATATINSGLNNQAFTLVALPAGPNISGNRLFVGGIFTTANGVTMNRVAIYKADGTLDSAFAPSSGADNQVFAAAAQADGKIVIGGQFINYNGTARADIARINQDGTLDTTFIPTGTAFNGQVNALSVLFTPSGNVGQIVAAGNFTTFNGTSTNYVARLSATGTLDGTFIPTSTGGNNGLLVQEDGNVIVRGGFVSLNSVSGTTAITRLGVTNGTRDTTFLAGGLSAAGTNFAPVVMRDNGQLFTANHLTGLAATLAATAPAITTQPVAKTAAPGDTVTFTVAATTSGGAPLSYQWLFNGVAISALSNPSAATATLSLTNVQLANVGSYSVALTNEVGTTTSSAVTLSGSATVPTITTQPTNQNVTANATATFSVLPAGLTYQWRRNGFPISSTANPSAATATLTITNTSRSDADVYDVQVINGLSAATSQQARLTVAPTSYPTLVGPDSAFDLRPEVVGGAVNVTLPLADGRVYVGGTFTSVNGVRRTSVVLIGTDGLPVPVTTGSFVPPEVDAQIRALAVQADGKLIIGGDFLRVGGVLRSHVARLNTDGSLDLTFNPNNVFLTTLTGVQVLALAVQSDGKILVGNNTGGLQLVRLNADGSRDLGYIPSLNSTVLALAVQGDGKAVIGGSFTTVNSVTRNDLARLNTDGSLDAGFGTTVGLNGQVNAVAVDANNKIVAGGTFTTFTIGATPTTVNRIARFSGTDGTLDTAFTTAGTSGVNIGSSGTVTSLALDSGGKIYVGGNFATFAGTARPNFARLGSDGSLDATFAPTVTLTGQVSALCLPPTTGKLFLGGLFTTFSGSGSVNITPVARFDTATAAVDATLTYPFRVVGNISNTALIGGGGTLVAGQFGFLKGNAVPFGLARLANDGSVDATFNTGGTGASGVLNAVAVQGDGKILIGGTFTSYNGTTRNRIARLTANGALDTTFAPTAASGTAGADSSVFVVLPLSGGRLFVGGQFGNINGVVRPEVGIFQPDGSLDTSFAPGTGAVGGSVTSALVQPDGKFIIAGNFTTYAGTTVGRIARLNPDGTLDMAFITAGTSGANIGANSSINAVALDASGRILICGSFGTFAGTSRSVMARLTSAGALDTSFNSASNGLSTISSFLVQEDGQIIVRGSFNQNLVTTPPVAPTWSMMRLNSTDGTRDTTFAAGGFTAVNVASANLAMRDNGALLAHGGTVGFAVSTAAALPAIATQPTNQSTTMGGTATFMVAPVAGTLPVTYQWLFNGQAVSGATGASFSLSNVQFANLGNYSVIVANELGSVLSNTVTLNGTGTAPTITVQPVATTGTVGGTVTLTVTAPGATAFQWRRNGVVITGNASASTATLTLTGVKLSDADVYDVVAWNGLADTTSNPVRVSIAPTAYPNGLKADASFNLALESNVQATAIVRAVLPISGKFYVAGDFTRINGMVSSRVARFNNDGTLDTGFTPPSFDAPVRALAVDSSGKLYVGGSFLYVDGVFHARLVRLNTNGTLDTSFTAFAGNEGNTSVFALAVQSDGKILAGGNFTVVTGGTSTGSGGVSRPGLVRLNTDGTPDLSYDAKIGGSVNALVMLAADKLAVGGSFSSIGGATRNNVTVLTSAAVNDPTFDPGTGPNFAVNALAFDGTRFVLGGSFTSYNGGNINRVVRINATGAVDSTFVTNLGTAANSTVNAIVALPTSAGYLVGGAFTTINAVVRNGVAKIGDTGALDTTYNAATTNNGITNTQLVGSNNVTSAGTVNALALDTNATPGLIIGGDFMSAFGSSRARLARTDTTTGTLESTLNPDVLAPASAYAIAPLATGQFLVLSNATRLNGTAIPAGLIRLNANKTLDASYNTGGSGLAFSGTGGTFQLLALPDGSAYVAGASVFGYNGVSRTGIVRIKPDGTLDSAFAPGTGTSSTVNALVAVPGGQVILGGNFTTFNGVTRNGLVRLNADGSIDSSLAAPSSAITVNAIALDGAKIYIGGSFTTYGTLATPTTGATSAVAAVRIARLNANGMLDSAFNTTVGANGTVTAITVQNDGKVLIGGSFSLVNAITRANLARLNPDGSVDRSFGSNFTNASGGVTGILIQNDGRIMIKGPISFINVGVTVVSGVDTAVFGSNTGIARLSANGVIDTTFGLYGFSSFAVNDYAFFDDGRVLLASTSPTVGFAGDTRPALTVLVPQTGVTISAQPAGRYVGAGQSAALDVNAGNGVAPLRYQWRKGGVNLPPVFGRYTGINARRLTFLDPQAADTGDYDCVVTDGATSATTLPARITVYTQVPIVSGALVDSTVSTNVSSFVPASSTTAPLYTFTEGTTVSLTGSATGTEPLTYQWQRNGANIVGATANVYKPGILTSAIAGDYTLVVTNSAGTTTSSIATLALANSAPVAPVILAGPFQVFATVSPGLPAYFNVFAAGTGPLTYQWQKNGTNIAGATNPELLIPAVTSADAGQYAVVVTNATGSVTSPVETLTLGNISVWTALHTQPTANGILKTAFGNGRYVAVTLGGNVIVSTDGITWTLRRQFSPLSLRDLVFGNGRFVAIGDNGAVATSTDGLGWSFVNINAANPAVVNQFVSVIFDGTRFVALDAVGAVSVSTDGATWTVKGTVNAQKGGLVLGSGGGGIVYIAGGDANVFYNSTDLVTWTLAGPLPTNANIGDVTYAAGKLYCVGSNNAFLISTDNGANFTSGDIDSANASLSWNAVATSGSRLVAANSSGSFATSDDGVRWTLQTATPVSLSGFNDVSYLNGQFVATGSSGAILTSSDGQTWAERFSRPLGLNTFRAITTASGGAPYVAVGDGGQIASSPDGSNWFARDAGTTVSLNGLVFANSKFVAAGNSGFVYSSPDGINWSGVSTANGNSYFGVTHDGTQFIAVGNNGRISTSPDAITWTERTSNSTSQFLGVAAGNGSIVAAGRAGTIVRSTDGGATWNAIVVPGFNSVAVIRGIVFGGGQYVAGVQDTNNSSAPAYFLTSPDGATWTIRNIPFTQSLLGIAYANGRYTVVGGSLSVLTSTDAINWSAETSNFGGQFVAVGFGSGGYVAVGTSGAIARASATPAPTVSSVAPTLVGANTSVTLTGVNFTGASVVSFNGTTATNFTVNSDTQITATAPATFTSGPVTVTTAGGTSLPLVSFTFAALPTITTQPVALARAIGTTATFSVVANANVGTLTYQWLKAGSPVSGQTAATYTINNVQLTDAANYSVAVTSPGGTVTSNSVALVVGTAPVITAQPANKVVIASDPVTFVVTASGSPTPTFQWRKGGVNISGATSPSYTITSTVVGDAGGYDVVVTNAIGSVTSNAATLTVQPLLHSADTNGDFQISLAELLRVIVLYNYTSGSTRTGEYRTQSGTSDGFAPGPGAITGAYHSADSNKDGKISLAELLRVIVLYNVSVGNARTGDYHPQIGTEDGFAPGK